jgi:hypothetical protein
MTANSASRTSPTGGIDKPRLTDAEKTIHILGSEQEGFKHICPLRLIGKTIHVLRS